MLSVKSLMAFCFLTVFWASSQPVHAQVASATEVVSVTLDLDINSLELEAKSRLYVDTKYETIAKLRYWLGSDHPLETKNRAALRLAELLIYSKQDLEQAESLLEKAKSLLQSTDFPQLAEAEYLLGVVDYIRSRVSTRVWDNQREKLREEGVGDDDTDPFLFLTLEHFALAATLPPCPAQEKALVALEANAKLRSFDGFQFHHEMGRLFDDGARLNTAAQAEEYVRVVETYEAGVVDPYLENSSISDAAKVDVLTGVSLAYFTLAEYDTSMKVSQRGIDRMGRTTETADLKMNRAYVWKYNQKYDLAEAEYEELIENYHLPHDWKITVLLKQVDVLLRQKDKIQKAKNRLQEVLNQNPAPAIKDQAQDLLTALEKVKGNQ